MTWKIKIMPWKICLKTLYEPCRPLMEIMFVHNSKIGAAQSDHITARMVYVWWGEMKVTDNVEYTTTL